MSNDVGGNAFNKTEKPNSDHLLTIRKSCGTSPTSTKREGPAPEPTDDAKSWNIMIRRSGRMNKMTSCSNPWRLNGLSLPR